MEETSLLSEAETARYRNQGYLALPDMCPPDEVGYIRRTLLELFANKTGYNEGAQYDFISRDDPSKPAKFPSLHDPRHYAPGLLKTSYHERTLELARQLLGEDAALYGEHALLKPALNGPETPWHQDEAFRSPDFVYNELSIWLALQPATLENGCMQFIPGSNRGDVLEHRSPGGDKTLHPLECCADFPRDQAVPEPLQPGGCTVHDARTLHFTGANTSPQPRLAYILIYNTPPVYKPGRREFPWLEGRWTDSQTRKKEWHRRGGLAVDVLRRLPGARLTSPRWVAWATIRAVSKVWPR
ncbi:phytanoyl-CoA dioxygenase family protein [Achromobacter sp. UMC71]|uniref:phytanoyl-CoA dioxygenase family protein n=1 Tax=Achromobacter sp. UMC71 TaxID=1862320 RepID=UPI0016010E33|nr:phytanoyl-CoA dioxygenase family protein [Achromobacter sp. UMC71]MBB1624077.1 phytanoyl-CoA dioxygenase [Achromobacter sp. UMC71]